MRPTATALILAIGLIAAACGGDEATKAPAADEATPGPVETAEVPAETTGASAESPQAPAETTEATAAALAKKAEHSSADDPSTTYALASGRYRILWDASVAKCERGDLAVIAADGSIAYEKSFKSSYATAVINELPEGVYTVEQRDAGCAEWSVRIDWMN